MEINKTFESCNYCPHKCGVIRNHDKGYCNTDDQTLISSIFLHKGEEPIISGENGICNVFFAHCNLQCIYCQNYQISRNDSFDPLWQINVDEAAKRICTLLDNDVKILGFVSPSHQIPQMLQIIESVRERGYKPTIVYNSNGYDNVESLKSLEGIVDVYLPDFKYFNNDFALKYSGVPDYFDVASRAIKEMYRQKGSTILLDDNGLIESGLIIRHLVLPGLSSDSIKILEYIADEISPFLHISLMSQYFPTENIPSKSSINRKLLEDEYNGVVIKLDEIGFKGWVQEIESSDTYRPDFYRDTPFND